MDLVVEQVTDKHLQHLDKELLAVAVVQDILMVVVLEDQEDLVVEEHIGVLVEELETNPQ